MSKIVTIPGNSNPWVCYVNGVQYMYEAGSTQTVPDAVAQLVWAYEAEQAKHSPQAQPTVEISGNSIKAGTGAEVNFTGASCKGFPTYTLPAATTSKLGGVKKAAFVADAAGATPTAAEFKALLDALKAAGIMSSST